MKHMRGLTRGDKKKKIKKGNVTVRHKQKAESKFSFFSERLKNRKMELYSVS